ncbi:hypothetical protein GCM10009647_090810 [Streptomyces sanglieri]
MICITLARLDCNTTDHERRESTLGEDACSITTRTPSHTVSADTSHSYITHLTEFGYPARFVQEQDGHSHAATTAIYMGVSNEYRNQLLEASLKGRLGDDWSVMA